MGTHFGFILTATRARPFWAGVAGALAGTALSLGGALAQDLEGGLAQDSGSMQVGGATVTVGAGAALLTLPDVPSFVTLEVSSGIYPFISGFKFSNDFGNEIGWNVNGSIEVPMGANRTVSLNGFWANIKGDDSVTCTAQAGQGCAYYPLVDDPAVGQSLSGSSPGNVAFTVERDVDVWGISLESKWALDPGVTQAPQRHYLALGADMRGIDQDLDVAISKSSPTVGPATYNENLDTRYYGAYAAWGGGYSIPFLSGLANSLGLQSSFLLRGGIYYADTDYEGQLTDSATGGGNVVNSALSLSSDNIAFIGGLALETRKRIGRRATLSLKSEYEYYSYVPEMAYNTVDLTGGAQNTPFTPGRQDGTNIGNGDAFSVRAMLRLSIKLGPDSIMEPLK